MAAQAELALPTTRSQGFLAGAVVKLFFFYLVLLLIAAIFIAPYLFGFFASFKPFDEILSTPPWLPPRHPTLSNYQTVLGPENFLRYLGNTLMVTVIITIGQVVFSLLGAYAFARLEFPGRDIIFWLYLTTLMVPQAVTLIPLYVIMDKLRLLDTYWALIVPYVLGTPYTIFLMRQFLLGIPESLFEAARLDGCGNLRILWTIVVPTSRPILITAALIAFVFSWNSFLWPLIAINSNQFQVNTVALANLQSNFSAYFNLMLAGSFVALIPMLIIFVVFQRYIVNSISLVGANK